MNQPIDDEPVQVSQTFPVSVSQLWQSITEKEKMVGWFFPEIQDFQATVGFQTQFTVSFEGNDYIHQWEVQKVVPESFLSYSWRYEGFEGDSVVSWQLSPVEQSNSGVSTRLDFRHTITKPFLTDDPAFSRDSCQGGWDYFLLQQMPAYFESKK